MTKIATVGTLVLAACGVLAACAENNPPPANVPQVLVQGTEPGVGVTAQQAATDDEVVERIAEAHCNRSASCNRVGPGAQYRSRNDCLSQLREATRKDVSACSCPGGIGEASLDQCVKSLENGECTGPGQLFGNVSHCKLNSLCIK
jgi:hypothetical protein